MLYNGLVVLLCLVSSVYGQTCTCDLISGECEVNCCCDNDCTDTDNSTFSSVFCDETEFNPSNEICIFNQIVFVTNSLLSEQTRVNDSYCVVENTISERNYYNNPSCIADNSCFNNLDLEYSYVLPASSPVLGAFYRSGDTILIEYLSGAQGLFSTPTATVSSGCDSDNPVKYLFSKTNTCTRFLTDLSTACVANSVLDYQTYEGFDVYAAFNPNESLTINSTTSNETAMAENITISIDSNCSMINCSLQLSGSTCSNSVTSVDYLFITDGLNGIVSLSVSYTLQSITAADLPLIQTFSVRFQNLNATNPIQRSGNPGYLVGRPLIVRLEDGTGSVTSNPDIFLFNPSPTGSCSLERLPILFGQDQRTGCLVNVTNDCSSLQQSIRTFLDTSVFDSNIGQVSVGIFGNAEIANSAGFFQLQAGNYSANPANSLTGCSGMILSSNFEVLFANTASVNDPQPKIAAIGHNYGNPQSIRFLCDPGLASCTQTVEISTSVTFVDISETALSNQRSLPTKEEQLPVSFLFPLTNIRVHVDAPDFFVWVIVFLSFSVLVIFLCI